MRVCLRSLSGAEPAAIKTVKQGSFSAVLDNRIRLSYSFYGPTGERTGITLRHTVHIYKRKSFFILKVANGLNTVLNS